MDLRRCGHSKRDSLVWSWHWRRKRLSISSLLRRFLSQHDVANNVFVPVVGLPRHPLNDSTVKLLLNNFVVLLEHRRFPAWTLDKTFQSCQALLVIAG